MANQIQSDLIPEKFDAKATDKELEATFRKWFTESNTYHEEILKKQNISERYYNGEQTNLHDIPIYLSNTVENRIFEAVETLVPVATANAHQFQVMPADPEDEKSVKNAQANDKVLDSKYRTLNIQEKLEDITRDFLIKRFGVLKPFWNDETQDIDVEVKDPRLIMVPRKRVKPNGLPYVIEIEGFSREEMTDFFDIKDEDLTMQQPSVETGIDKEHKKGFQVFEVSTSLYKAWFHNNKVVRREINPYFDFEGEKVKIEGSRKKETKFFNHFDLPKKNYIFFAGFNVSSDPLPDTSLVETVIPIADAINVQKRGIINNLKFMGNGQVYVDSDAMTEEEADNMTNEPGLILRGAGLASEQKIRREPGVPLPNAHFANLQHSELVFDNIMGVHSATRGAAQARTLGQDVLSRQQDFTRIDTITRVLNRGVDELANWFFQLMRMFYDETHIIKILGEERSVETIKFNRDQIEEGIELVVTSGTQLPMDEVALRTEAVQLWQFGAIDPTTLFERLKFPNPEKAAQRLQAWKSGQLTQETEAKIAQDQAKNKGKQTPQGGNQNNPKGRGGESITDVITRAREALAKSPASTEKK